MKVGERLSHISKNQEVLLLEFLVPVALGNSENELMLKYRDKTVGLVWADRSRIVISMY